MGITILVEDGMPKLRPLKSRIDAIQKVMPPRTIKEFRSFCGMVNYMSMFLPSLQEKLNPIYFITRKGIHSTGVKNNRKHLMMSREMSQVHQFY